MNRVRDILIHILCCAAFLAIPIFLSRENTGSFAIDIDDWREVLGYSLTLGYFYLNFYYLIPEFYLRRNYASFTLITLAVFTIITLLPRIAIPYVTLPKVRPRTFGDNLLFDINHNLFRFIAVFLISLMLRIRDQWKRAREDKTTAELAFLKSQIQPHFLYNTLNTIYALSIEQAPQTPDAIAQLSSMMRYVTDESARDFVPLERELKYIQSYITLQELRFGRTVGISSIVTGEPDGYEIAPMMLIPFIENAFKHGINPEEESGIVVRININNGELRMNVRNRLVRVLRDDERGLGLANTKSRLELLYSGRYELSIFAKDDVYSINITLTLG
ncbi:MAG: sensor histidine kinase [Chitinophagaceae bacterium]